MRKAHGLLPDLILLDLMFPRHGGRDVMTFLQSGLTKDIPIIAMSGYSKDKFTLASIREEPNVVGFLPKPLNTERLISALHDVLKTRPAKGPLVSKAS